MQSIGHRACQRGSSLVELLIAMTLGMLVILAVSGLVISAKSLQAAEIDAAVMNDTAVNALNNILRSVRQAGFVDYTNPASPLNRSATASPSIIGLDASTLKASSYGIDSPSKSQSNASDILAVRFYGLQHGSNLDSISNCAGFDVPAASNNDDDRGWSIYYVANDSSGEPNLYCKYKNKNFTAQSIGTGIESFQVLYGLDTSTPPNKIANSFVSATEIEAMNAGLAAGERDSKNYWKKVTAIKVSLLIHGSLNSSTFSTGDVFNLFGALYPATGNRAGITVTEADTPNKTKKRQRKIYSTTIQIKNSVS